MVSGGLSRATSRPSFMAVARQVRGTGTVAGLSDPPGAGKRSLSPPPGASGSSALRARSGPTRSRRPAGPSGVTGSLAIASQTIQGTSRIEAIETRWSYGRPWPWNTVVQRLAPGTGLQIDHQVDVGRQTCGAVQDDGETSYHWVADTPFVEGPEGALESRRRAMDMGRSAV
jgi:hypothetical protein